MTPRFARQLETRPMTLEEAEELVGSVGVDGRMLSAAEIAADPKMARATRAKNIVTGVMEESRSKCLFITVKA